ncbi:MAG TPA: ATP-binding SpoIIE family protein phosphatase [Streptosporangiaceae bacterium]|nr:ATP-binding SpoIIE family protein phosphatase [Streptosporangiaceae bacterium]
MPTRNDGWTKATDIGEHLGYLHGATARIGGGLELDQVVRALCDTTVPEIADLAAVYLYESVLVDGELPEAPDPGDLVVRQAAVAGGEGWGAAGLTAKVTASELTGPFAAAMARGRPAVWHGDHDGRPGLRSDVDCVLTRPWPGSVLVVPLRLDRLVLGFGVLLRAADRGAFTEAGDAQDVDVVTATLMADQAALGIHKAILYQREAQIADELQRSMLPKRPPRLPGIDIAHRYLPGNPTAQVGGDWFDAIPLAGSRVALVVGDVMGHGVRSAAAMGQLRIAARTLATLDPPPDQVLRQLDQLFNDMAEQLDEHYLATCIYCVYDPVARRCAIANAGHVPPVFIYPDGRTELIQLPTGAPVGVGGVAFQTFEMAAPDGALLAMCTDGLVESPDRDLNDGLAILLDSVQNAAKTHLDPAAGAAPVDAAPLEDLCEQVLRDLHIDGRVDDVALLVARFGGIPSEHVANWILRAHPQTPFRARRLVAATLSGWGLTGQIPTMELLVTELVTNAIRYATRPIAVRLLRTETSLLCEVTDDDHNPPVLCEPTTKGENGRGVYLVSRLARRWGTSLTPTGKSVWCEVALP